MTGIFCMVLRLACVPLNVALRVVAELLLSRKVNSSFHLYNNWLSAVDEYA